MKGNWKVFFKGIFLLVCIVMVPVSTVFAQACEGNFDLDQDVDGTDAAKFKEDFGRSALSNPCPEPPTDNPPSLTKYERMFCHYVTDCWNAGYRYTTNGTSVCCCGDKTGIYKYGCRGWDYCELTLGGFCF